MDNLEGVRWAYFLGADPNNGYDAADGIVTVGASKHNSFARL